MSEHTATPGAAPVVAPGALPGQADKLIAANIRAERARAGLGQPHVADRMLALGYEDWHPQTVSKIETGRRRVLADELPGLALSMGCAISALIGGIESLVAR